MEHKLLIAGGVGAVGLVVLVAAKRRRSASSQSDSSAPAAMQSDFSGMLYSPPPISGGYSSGYSDAGSASSGGGAATGDATAGFQIPNLSDLLGKMLDIQKVNQHEQVISGEHTSDSAALASLNLGAYGGSAALSHTDNGTTFSMTPSESPQAQRDKSFVDSLYQSMFGRAPDAGGEAYWINAVQHGTSYNDVVASFQNSSEMDAKTHPEKYNIKKDANGTIIAVTDKVTGIQK